MTPRSTQVAAPWRASGTADGENGGVTILGLLDDDGIDRLRDALRTANYTSDGIAERLGPDITDAVARNDYRKALQVTEDRDPLSTLIRLYVCGQTEPEATVQRAFQHLDVGELLVRTDGGYRAGVDLEPYGEGEWILSDLPGATLRKDHVLGVGGASTTLANAVIREPVERLSISVPDVAYRHSTCPAMPPMSPRPTSPSGRSASRRPRRDWPGSTGTCAAAT